MRNHVRVLGLAAVSQVIDTRKGSAQCLFAKREDNVKLACLRLGPSPGSCTDLCGEAATLYPNNGRVEGCVFSAP